MQISSSVVRDTYQLGKAAVAPAELSGSLGSALKSGVSAFERNLGDAEAVARAAFLGQSTPHALVQALTSSESAVETAVTMRNKVVEAYQEILRMPV